MSDARLTLTVIATLPLLVLSQRASGAIVTYFEPQSFLAAAGPVAFESFEQYSLAFQTNPPLQVGAFTVTSVGPFGVLSTGPTNGQHATHGVQYLVMNSREITFTFAEPVMALAMDFVDFGDLPLFFGSTLSLSTSAGDSVTVAQTIADYVPTNGQVIFFGFTSDVSVTEVVIRTTQPDHVAIDSVRSSPIPEPSVGVLCMCGAGLACLRRRPLGPSAKRSLFWSAPY